MSYFPSAALSSTTLTTSNCTVHFAPATAKRRRCFIRVSIAFRPMFIWTWNRTWSRNINSCLLLLSRTDEGNQALQEFLAARNPRQQHSSTLESYLIKPIQRILKYPLLLQQLRNLTDPNCDEHQHLVGKSLKLMIQIFVDSETSYHRDISYFWCCHPRHHIYLNKP